MQINPLFTSRFTSSLFGLLLSLAVPVFAADAVPPAVSGNAVQMTKQTSINQIRALPDNTILRMPSGRVMTAKRFKTLADAITQARKVGPAGTPDPKFAFSRTQSAPQLQLKPGVNLREVAKRPDSDVLQLPDGRKLTVGDLKKLSALQQRRTGKSLLDAQASARPSREGPAIRVDSREDLGKLGDKPDSTVLETRTGKRITLGELRALAKAQGKAIGELK